MLKGGLSREGWRTALMRLVPLATYDWIVISTSGGKDSQVALDEAVKICDLKRVDRRRIVAVHCDLGRVEWQGTRELAEEQARHYGVRFLAVSREQGDLLDHVAKRGKWPGYTTRYCTADHKTGQVRRVVTALSRCYTGRGARPGSYHLPDDWEVPPRVTSDGPVRVLDVLGLRAQESPKRQKMQAYTQGKRATSTVTVDQWLPVHGWTEAEVWQRIDKIGTSHHQAYELGMPRLSCVLCIYAGEDALVLAGSHNQELVRQYVAVEEAIGHTFKPDLSLRQVLDRIEAGDVPNSRCDTWAA